MLAVLAELDAWDRVCLAGYHDPWLRVARRLARAHGAPLFTSMGHTAVVGLRMRGWTRRETARPGGRRRPPRVRTGRLASVRGDLAQLPHRFAGVTVVDADVLRVSHESGREVHVWTVDDPAVMGGLLDRRRRRDPHRPPRPAAGPAPHPGDLAVGCAGERAERANQCHSASRSVDRAQRGSAVSELASESVSQRLRPARELASAPSAQRPAKPTERSEGAR